MPANAQQLNAAADLVRQVRALYDAAFAIKSIRPRCEALGVFTIPADQWPGDLDHLTPAKLASLVQAMDALDAAFVSPVIPADPTSVPVLSMIGVMR